MSVAHIPGSDSLLELPRMLADPIQFLRERHAQYGDVFRTRWVFPLVFLVGPEANRTVHLTERQRFSYQKGYGPLAVGAVFDNSLLLLDGAAHQHDRDIVQPSMGRLALSGCVEDICAIWERAAARIDGGTPTDVFSLVQDATFEVSAKVLVGLRMEDLAVYRPLFEQLVAGTMAHLKVRVPFGKLDRALRARNELLRLLEPRIEAARTEEPSGMLGMLAHHRDPDGTPVPTRRIAEHLLLLYWAGYDTTASTGSWLLCELARNAVWQERVAREQDEVLGTSRLAMEATSKMVATGHVLKEVERHRPAGLFFPRALLEEVTVAGVTVPRGTTVFYSPYLSHRSPRHWEAPDVFDPGRWEEAPGKKPASTAALVGFGAGPRICLGKAFALLQLRVMVSTLLRRFRVEVDPARPELGAIGLPLHRPANPYLVFRSRNDAGTNAHAA